MGAKPAGVKRFVFKEIVDGDTRKFRAKSNDTDSGGGARDLRLPYAQFAPIFRKMFPDTRIVKRLRDGVTSEVEVSIGSFCWTDSTGNAICKEASFEPPTTSRKTEGRIPVVYTYPPFASAPSPGGGRLVVLLVQRDDDSVWPEFATEESLSAGGWDDAVAIPIIRALNATRGGNQIARGYVDFETGEEYPDA